MGTAGPPTYPLFVGPTGLDETRALYRRPNDPPRRSRTRQQQPCRPGIPPRSRSRRPLSSAFVRCSTTSARSRSSRRSKRCSRTTPVSPRSSSSFLEMAVVCGGCRRPSAPPPRASSQTRSRVRSGATSSRSSFHVDAYRLLARPPKGLAQRVPPVTGMASRARLRRLHDANDELIRSLNLGDRLRNAVKAARDLVPADAAAVLLPDEEGEALVIRAQEGLSERYAAQQRIPM